VVLATKETEEEEEDAAEAARNQPFIILSAVSTHFCDSGQVVI